MKKLFASVAAAALALSLSTTAFAATTTNNLADTDSTAAIPVSAIVTVAEAEDVISVDVSWDSAITFTYEFTDAGTWNPATHTYDEAEGEWTDAEKIVNVTNHSNVEIKAWATYEKGESDDATLEKNVTITSDKANKSGGLVLASGEGLTKAEAATGAIKITAGGKPAQTEKKTAVQIGTLTINIST